MFAVSHLSSVIAARPSALLVLERLWCHISRVRLWQHTQLSQYWDCCGITSLKCDSRNMLSCPSTGMIVESHLLCVIAAWLVVPVLEW